MNDENKRAGENAESSPFNLRLPHATRDALDAVAAQLPILSKHRIAVAALDIGLAALAANPLMVLSVKVAPSGASVRGARGASSSASVRGARGASSSGSATDDQAPEEPPLVRAPSMPPPRASVRPPPARDPARFSSPLPALPEAVGPDDDHEPVEARHTEPHAAPALDAAAVRARLIELRAADPKAWSYSKIAERIGMSEGPPEKVVTGRPVSPDTLKRIAAILP